MKRPKKNLPLALIAVFLAAVLVPSVALSLLALRAGVREALYVERRMESALLSEVDLAVRRVEGTMDDLLAELMRGSDETSSLLAVSFVLRDGQLRDVHSTFLAEPTGGDHLAAFYENFATFLTSSARIPVYEGIAGVYRKEMAEDKGFDQERDKGLVARTQERFAPSVAETALPEPPAVTGMADDVAQFEVEEEATSPPSPAPAQGTATSAPERTLPASKSQSRPDDAPGMLKQIAQSAITESAAVREEAYQIARDEGFEVTARNVAPQAALAARDARPDERSATVSRSRSFPEIASEGNGGLLPRLTDGGLELLFWAHNPDGTIRGGTLDMDRLRDRVAGTIPDMLTEVRLLTVLDESGAPIVAPDATVAAHTKIAPDWRRPFVAREISPLLPRWEAGAWLVDPGALDSSAAFTRRAVWVLVATLFVVIATGGAAVLRMTTAELRTARQKTTFVANVSHELKTPLTSIRLFAELLLSGKQSDEEKKHAYLRTMVSETERLTNLVDNVLAFSRRDGGNEKQLRAECVSLSEIARETCEQLEPSLARNGFSLRVDCAQALPVTGDREALRQVLMNLLSNAEKYSDATREIDVSCGADGTFAHIAVADRGIGVPQFAREKIWGEFYRADDSLTATKSGAGLGLAIARDIARKHGGDISYKPRDGGGSVFTLRVPLRKEAAR